MTCPVCGLVFLECQARPVPVVVAFPRHVASHAVLGGPTEGVKPLLDSVFGV